MCPPTLQPSSNHSAKKMLKLSQYYPSSINARRSYCRILSRKRSTGNHHAYLPATVKAESSDANAVTLAGRRLKLAGLLPADSVAIFPSNGTVPMSNDVDYPFHQETNLLWLCGYRKPDSLLVMTNSAAVPEMFLFIDVNRQLDKWVGRQPGVSEVSAALNEGVKGNRDVGNAFLNIHRISEARPMLSSMLSQSKSLFLNATKSVSPKAFNYISSALPSHSYIQGAGASVHPWLLLKEPPQGSILPIRTPLPFLHQLRAVKDPTEIMALREAARITASSFCETMKAVTSGCLGNGNKDSLELTEEDVASHLECGIRRRGVKRLAFPPVIAGGRNALAIHYMDNDKLIPPDSLVLMDAGAQINDYCSDMTRTFPRSGAFSPAQQDIYDIVRRAQMKCFQHLEQGPFSSRYPFTLMGLQLLAQDAISAGLRRLGFGPLLDSNGKPGVGRFFPHMVGHHIGLDVHDCQALPSDTPLRPNMVVCVEPGIYVDLSKEECSNYPMISQYDGIGVRIEDMVVIPDKSEWPDGGLDIPSVGHGDW